LGCGSRKKVKEVDEVEGGKQEKMKEVKGGERGWW
jgi:hypothetical protein